MDIKERKLRFETMQLHSGQAPDGDTRSRAVPIYQTQSYMLEDTQAAADIFALRGSGYFYTRLSNPTTDTFEQRMAQLEGGVAALAVATGHSAQFIALSTLMRQGDNFVSSPYIYGGSYNQFKTSMANFGIECRFSVGMEVADMESLIDENTKLLYVESISNSNLSIPDFEALAELAHRHGIPLMVDNTLGAAGYLCRPFDWGADIIVESATKWICGHGTSMGGVIVDAGRFDWDNGKFPLISEPAQSYHGLRFTEQFGNLAFIVKCRVEGLRDIGPAISPFNSFLMLQGLETLSLRVEREAANSMALARYLEAHPMVKSVNYPGLEGHRWHGQANKYLHNGFGCVLFIELDTTMEKTARFVDSLQLISHMSNLGDSKTIIIQPAATTHSQLDSQAKARAGIAPSMLRISVGTEHIDDLIEDLEGGFEAICNK